MNPITKAIQESDEEFITELLRLQRSGGELDIIRLLHSRDRKILEAVKEIAESVIQSERYSGTPFSMNVLLKQIDEAIKDIK